MSEIYQKLSAKFPEEAIQRTKSAETHRGYDTTGIGYQYVVDRLNEVCGINNWGFSYEIIKEIEGKYRDKSDGTPGMPFFDITVNISMWVGDKENVKPCAGGHISPMYGDALKGAITSGIKKTAALFGVGAEAYRGAIDEDNRPLPGGHSDRNNTEWVRSSIKPKKEQAAEYKAKGIGKWTKEGENFIWWWKKGHENLETSHGGTAPKQSGDFVSAEQAIKYAKNATELSTLTQMIERRSWAGDEQARLIEMIDSRMADILVGEFKGEESDASFPT